MTPPATWIAEKKRVSAPAAAGAEWTLPAALKTEGTTCVPHPSFKLARSEAELFGPNAPRIDIPQWQESPAISDGEPTRAAPTKVLKAQEEVTLFLRYNYARYRWAKLLKADDRSPAGLEQLCLWQGRAMQARADLFQANMALVRSMAHRARLINVEFEELVAEGNMAVLRSIDKFDVSRGFKFSTYACRSILKCFQRLSMKSAAYHQKFPMSFEPDLEQPDPNAERNESRWEYSVDSLTRLLAGNAANLTTIEKTVIIERFGLGSRGKGRTFQALGDMLDMSYERVRQILNQALRKMRDALERETLAA